MEPAVGDSQPRCFSFRNDLELHMRITCEAFIAPCVCDKRIGFHIGDRAKMNPVGSLMLYREREFESYNGLEFGNIKIPLLHLVFACQGLPDLFAAGVERPLNDNGFDFFEVWIVGKDSVLVFLLKSLLFWIILFR